MLEFERKLKENFGSAVVNKKKVLEHEISELPRYVSEYLIGAFCDEEVDDEGLADMDEYVKEHRINGKEREHAKFRLQREESLKLIDKFKVKIDLKNNTNSVEVPSMGINALSNPDILREHPRLMLDGLWGMGEVYYNSDNGEINLSQFKPFQISEIDIKEYTESRSEFTTEEWLNVMMSTVGLNYENYNRREKFVLLSRLIPMVEKNVFMMEFGLPGTGKTYAYENISSYSRVISGSKVTEAQLFYNITEKRDGLLLQYDVLLFDEIDKVRKKGLGEGITNKFYQYLASGKFDRGNIEKVSECGIMMVGNLPSGPFYKERLLSNSLHESNKIPAFLDRLAGVVPGWELESIKDPKIAFTKNYGFSADYFSEIFTKLREENYPFVLNRIEYDGASIRDTNAVEKLVKGFIKLIYPDGQLTYEELVEVVEISIEYRQFVLDQNYSINKGEKRIINYEIREY